MTAKQPADAPSDPEPRSKSKRRRSPLRTVLTILIVIIAALAALWVFGPREPVDLTLRLDPAMIGEDLEAYLARGEAAHEDIFEGAEKQIVWAFPSSRARTPLALVYVHGFSASAGEIRPVMDMAAQALEANLFYTRLSGHGRSPDAMAEPTVQDWMDDVAEAIAIAERLGERVVLVGKSSGGTLVALAALHPDLAARIDGVIFLSPNFGVKAAGSTLLTFPFARQFMPLLIGAERGFEPLNARHAEMWTERYPTTALLPMAAAVARANAQFYENVEIPALFVFSDADEVVDSARTRVIAERWGADAETVAIAQTDDPSNHILAGDILSPSTNDAVAGLIADWIAALR